MNAMLERGVLLLWAHGAVLSCGLGDASSILAEGDAASEPGGGGGVGGDETILAMPGHLVDSSINPASAADETGVAVMSGGDERGSEAMTHEAEGGFPKPDALPGAMSDAAPVLGMCRPNRICPMGYICQCDGLGLGGCECRKQCTSVADCRDPAPLCGCPNAKDIGDCVSLDFCARAFP